MNEILQLMPVLWVAIGLNIALGMYYKIGKEKISFNWRVLIQGIIKAIIIASSFIGLAYCFEQIDLTSIGITPKLIMGLAITLYVTKDLQHLSNILGVEIKR